MSLLNQAASYSEGTSSNGKKNPRMQQTFETIQREQYKEPSFDDFDKHNKVQKEREEKVTAILEKMQNQSDADGLADFTPLNLPTESVPKLNTFVKLPAQMQSTSRESFTNPSSVQKQTGSSYTNSYLPTPYYKGLSTKTPDTVSPNNQLMEKLNYMIHMLEEQQKEPTQNILEEFILYGLLGIFMIYLVDSFARAGKYIR
jgi:hypothetical protein